MLKDERLRKLWSLAEPLLREGRALKHTSTALRLAEKLIKQAGGDELVVMAAVILHDVGYAKTKLKWTQVSSGSKLPEHMEEGARIARRLMEEAGFNGWVREKVEFIVKNHDTLRGETLRGVCLNVKLALEADRLAGWATPYGVKTVAKLERKSPLKVLEDFESQLDELLATSVAKDMAKQMIAELRRKIKA